MKKDVAHSSHNRDNLPTSRPSGFFTPWSNDYWEPSRWFDNFFNSDLSVFPTDNRFLSPAIDIDETADEFVVSADLPGLNEEDISIDCSGNQLTISAERKYDSDNSKKQGRRERFFGTYRRTFTLPSGVDTNKIEAGYEGGVLIVHIPKGEQVRSKRIPINGTKKEIKEENKH